MKTTSTQRLDELIERYPALFDLRAVITQVVDVMCESYNAGGKILVCGNGGSASDSEHIVGELMKGFVERRELTEQETERFRQSGLADWEHLVKNLQRAIPGIALTGHPSLSSAVLNDNDPYMVYAQQVFGYGTPNDILIGISTSGNARNVCNAIKVAKVLGMKTIGFTGPRESEFDKLCDIVIHAPGTETFKIQEHHLPIYHTICIMVEQEIFGE